MVSVAEWIASLSSAAKVNVPLVFAVRVKANREVFIRGRVAEVGTSFVVVVAPGRPRFVACFKDILDVRRTDGRPWRARMGRGEQGDGRAELRDAAEAHADAGGLE